MGIREIFAANLKKIANNRGIKQKDLAKRCGLSETYVSLLANGKKTPTIDTAKRIADALGVQLAALLGEETDFFDLLKSKKGLSDEDVNAVRSFVNYLLNKDKI